MPALRSENSASRLNVGFVALGLVVVVATGGLLLDRFFRDPAFVPPNDFLEYWAAGRLNAEGHNPYDPEALWTLQRAAGRPLDHPAVLWNPPWALTLVMPFGLLPPRAGQLAWLLTQVAAVVLCADRLWVLYGGRAALRPFAAALALTFYPVMHLLLMGQSGGWLLLGLTALAVAGGRGPTALAAVAALAAVKPHLFIPVWIALAVHALACRRGRSLLAWGVLAGMLAALVPLAANPHVWSEYFATFTRPPDPRIPGLADWHPPLAGYWLRQAVAGSPFWVQVVPAAVAALLVPFYAWSRRHCWDWAVELPRLVLAGLIAAPYGAWEHDHVVLLIPVVAAAARLSWSGRRPQVVLAAAVYLTLDGVGLALRDSESFVGLPVAVAVWYAAVMRIDSSDSGQRRFAEAFLPSATWLLLRSVADREKSDDRREGGMQRRAAEPRPRPGRGRRRGGAVPLAPAAPGRAAAEGLRRVLGRRPGGARRRRPLRWRAAAAAPASGRGRAGPRRRGHDVEPALDAAAVPAARRPRPAARAARVAGARSSRSSC